MILSDYRTKVQNEADDTSARAQAIIDRAIKEVYQEIIRYASQDMVAVTTIDETAVVGTADYTPLTDFIDMKAVTWLPVGETSYSTLQFVTYQDFLKRWQNADNGTPYAYTVTGKTQKIMPAPSEVGTIRTHYTPVQDELTGDVVSILPDRYTNLVVQGAMARFMAYERVPDANEYMALYKEALNMAMQEMGTQTQVTRPKLF